MLLGLRQFVKDLSKFAPESAQHVIPAHSGIYFVSLCVQFGVKPKTV